MVVTPKNFLWDYFPQKLATLFVLLEHEECSDPYYAGPPRPIAAAESAAELREWARAQYPSWIEGMNEGVETPEWVMVPPSSYVLDGGCICFGDGDGDPIPDHLNIVEQTRR